MSDNTQYVRLQLRQDTTENWNSANPVLLEGEMGYNTDTKQFKIGNGINSWNTLDYYKIPINYNDIDNKPTIGEGLITLNFNGNKLGRFNVNTTESQTIDILGFKSAFPILLDAQNNLTLLYDEKMFIREKENGKFSINLEYLASALKQYM